MSEDVVGLVCYECVHLSSWLSSSVETSNWENYDNQCEGNCLRYYKEVW